VCERGVADDTGAAVEGGSESESGGERVCVAVVVDVGV
jgi:hypothetical protein